MKPYYDDGRGIVIYHGNCHEILPQFPKVDLVLTDPPYGIKADNRSRILSRGKLATPTDYGESNWDSVPPSNQEIQLIISKGTQAIVWGGNYWTQTPSAAWLVWDKENGETDFADCELAWTNLDQTVRKFSFMWNGMIRAGEAKSVKREHPTQKPVELMRWCIRFTHCTTILDPFMGSGTTLRAAKDIGRRAIGIEIEERYCEIAARRLQQEVLQFNYDD